MTTETPARTSDRLELVPSALLPEGYVVPTSRWTDPSTRMRELLDTEPFLFGPGVYDPQGAELAMYYGFKAVYFSGYSFAIGHLGTTDMDLYSGPEIADGARRTISALRKFQLTMAVGDPEKGTPPKHLEIPPVVVDIARTDGVSAVDAPEKSRGIELAIERALRYLDSGIPDLLWCEFPTSEREPVERFADQVRRRFPEARFAFNWSSSFKWFNDPDPITFAQLGDLGYRFLFITLGAQHAMAHGLSTLLQGMSETQEQAYIELQRKEWEKGADLPSKSHHFFSGVPYHQLVGESFGGSRLGTKFQEKLAEERVV